MIETRPFSTATPTILIVDDTPANLGVIVESLEQRGFRILVAQDGEEGLQRATLAQPDLILLDVMMPGPDGFEICRRLKSQPKTRKIPVIFMTSLTDTEHKVTGFGVGAVDYVTKPLQIEEVALRVDLHLQLHTMQKLLETQNRKLHHYQETLEQQVAERTAQLSEANRQLSTEIDERKRAEEQLWESERQYRTLVQNSPDLIIRYDLECRRIFVSDAYLQMHGRPPDMVLGKRPTEVWCSSRLSAADFERKLHQVIESGERAEIELDWYTPQDDYICHWMLAVPEYDRDGNVVSVLSITRDVSEFKRAERALHLHEQELRSLVENTPDTIARYDSQCHLIYANPRMLEDLGAPLEQVLEQTPSDSPVGETAIAYTERIRRVLESGLPEDFEVTWKSASGEQIVSHIRLTPEFGVNGEISSVLAVGRDITEIAEYRQSIHHLAFYDALTDLPNRSLLIDRIRQAIAESARHGQQFGLMMLDLDRFKEINDTLGHGVGDMLLRQAAERIVLCVRNYDTVARLGGDEFAILLPDVHTGTDLAMIGNKLLELFRQPFQVSGKELFVTTSIGVALYPTDSAEIDALFRYADSAMYHAKKQGRNNCQFYSAELTARSSERMLLESALRKARKNHELELYYQPQISLTNRRLIGAEALLRWNHPERGLVTPDRFIPVAEETGLIVDMGEWILETACKTSVAWNLGRSHPLRIAVNLSTRQFIQNDLLGSVQRILARTHCKPEWLKLEITESLLLEDSEEILATLSAFAAMGLAISIDDFGTGYSALSYLNRFPVSQIKIDRSFVHDIPDDEDKSELVKAIISISQALHLELVAEGVETWEQADYLLANGCRTVQGYLFGKPMPLSQFEVLLDDLSDEAE